VSLPAVVLVIIIIIIIIIGQFRLRRNRLGLRRLLHRRTRLIGIGMLLHDAFPSAASEKSLRQIHTTNQMPPPASGPPSAFAGITLSRPPRAAHHQAPRRAGTRDIRKKHN